MLQDISDEVECDDHSSISPQTFYPYPNRSAFWIGDWYWNGSTQKSQASFRELISIIGDPDFSSEDVRHMQWAKIDHFLAESSEWIDDDKTGWEKTQVSILVLHQHHRGMIPSANSTPQLYTEVDFYH